jgi:hypothetical protein
MPKEIDGVPIYSELPILIVIVTRTDRDLAFSLTRLEVSIGHITTTPMPVHLAKSLTDLYLLLMGNTLHELRKKVTHGTLLLV